MTKMWAFQWSLKLKTNLITQWRPHTVSLEKDGMEEIVSKVKFRKQFSLLLYNICQ